MAYLLEVSQAVFELTERQAGATSPVVRLGCEEEKKKKRCKPTSLTTGTLMKPNHRASKRRTREERREEGVRLPSRRWGRAQSPLWHLRWPSHSSRV